MAFDAGFASGIANRARASRRQITPARARQVRRFMPAAFFFHFIMPLSIFDVVNAAFALLAGRRSHCRLTFSLLARAQ